MYKHILAPVDGSRTSIAALDVALRIARETDAELHPVYIVDAPLVYFDSPGYDPSILRDAMLSEGARVTGEASARMQHDHVRGTALVLEVASLGDSVAQRILSAASELAADLVIMGTHGRRGVQRMMLGSVAERFVRMACCPVLLVPHAHAGTAGRVQLEQRRLSNQ